MTSLGRRLFLRSIMATVRFLLKLPEPLLRLAAGPPTEVDGQRLETTAQLLVRMSRLAPFDYPHENGGIGQARAELDEAGIIAGAGIYRDVRTTDLELNGLALRLYEPPGLAGPGPGLVFFHGGGFVLGSVDTHDGACRCLAAEAGIRVVSAEYRLAPEHRFPAAVDDAIAAFSHVSAHAPEFGIEPGRVAVGGDSSGGNLAAVVAHASARGEAPQPAFSLLLNPATDAFAPYPSQEMFGLGFRLDTAERDWYRDQYLDDFELWHDPRASVLYDDQLDGLPPTYVATSGFDPLRDEGEAYARRLADAGVPVIQRRHEGLLHGFASRVGIDPASRAALRDAAGVLREALVLVEKPQRNAGS